MIEFFDMLCLPWKNDSITNKYCFDHTEQLLSPESMKPSELACACTYLTELDNPYSFELMRRSGHLEEYKQASDAHEKRKIFDKSCAFYSIIVV